MFALGYKLYPDLDRRGYSTHPRHCRRKPWVGLYKIFVHYNAFVNEPIIIVLPLPPVRPTLLQ